MVESKSNSRKEQSPNSASFKLISLKWGEEQPEHNIIGNIHAQKQIYFIQFLFEEEKVFFDVNHLFPEISFS